MPRVPTQLCAGEVAGAADAAGEAVVDEEDGAVEAGKAGELINKAGTSLPDDQFDVILKKALISQPRSLRATASPSAAAAARTAGSISRRLCLRCDAAASSARLLASTSAPSPTMERASAASRLDSVLSASCSTMTRS